MSALINYYDVLCVLQQCFRICVCCQCMNPVSSSSTSFSSLSHQSYQLNATALPVKIPTCLQMLETCFSLGPSTQPSSPSALMRCFWSTAEYFDHSLWLSLSSPMWPEDAGPQLQPCEASWSVRDPEQTTCGQTVPRRPAQGLCGLHARLAGFMSAETSARSGTLGIFLFCHIRNWVGYTADYR